LDTNHNPIVSIVVPARNEEASLAQCLESLVAQSGIDFEVIVVDDASTDRTAEIARSFPGVQVIEAGRLPENWTGKNNAMAAGAKIAHPEAKWLLFTDADTVHKPGSLARAVAEAERHGAALLSYSPEQEVRSFWEKAVMPVIFAELAATYPPEKVNDPAFPIAAANGQYLLISREAYDAVGGHTKIASDLLEDVAMARRVKFSGRRIFFRYGGDAVRTRMYRSWAQMKEGWSKNLALLFPRPSSLAITRGTECFFILGSAYAGLLALSMERFQLAFLALLLAMTLAVWLWTRIRRAHFSSGASLLAFSGMAIFAYLLLRSATLHRRCGVTWKGRTYDRMPRTTPHTAPSPSSAGAASRSR
jgi:GT2 family glycosyltransferase